MPEQDPTELVLEKIRKHIKPEAIETVLNRPAEKLGGLSIMQSLEEDPAATWEVVKDYFDWQQANGS